MHSEVDASSTQVVKKAISVQPCACTHSKENNTETNLRRLALAGQTVKNLRSFAYKFELDQSECKPLQVHASHGQTELQVNVSFQLAITCDSVWPGLYTVVCVKILLSIQ